jgi:hypothetical protein
MCIKDDASAKDLKQLQTLSALATVLVRNREAVAVLSRVARNKVDLVICSQPEASPCHPSVHPSRSNDNGPKRCIERPWQISYHSQGKGH